MTTRSYIVVGRYWDGSAAYYVKEDPHFEWSTSSDDALYMDRDRAEDIIRRIPDTRIVEVLVLNRSEAEQFLADLDDPPDPSPRLREAFNRAMIPRR